MVFNPFFGRTYPLCMHLQPILTRVHLLTPVPVIPSLLSLQEKGVHESPGVQRKETQKRRGVLQEEKLQSAKGPPARGGKRSLDLLATGAA